MILRKAASAMIPKAKAKSRAKSRPKAQPRKKSKNATPAPQCFEKWPVYRPFDIFSALVSAGMVSELCHACVICSGSQTRKLTP